MHRKTDDSRRTKASCVTMPIYLIERAKAKADSLGLSFSAYLSQLVALDTQSR